MKWGEDDCPADCIQGADEVCIIASRELVLLVQHDRVEALAKQALPLAAGNEKLHLDTVDLSA